MEIDASSNTLNVVNEVAGMTLSVSDAGGTAAATTLGIRSLKASTQMSVFNNGRGVEIAHGELDPTTGLPNPDRNVDFRVTLSDGTTGFDVDLVPADLADLSTLIAKINAESGGAGGFTASLSATQNSIVFSDALGGGTPIAVTSLNGYAAEDLGLLDGTVGSGNELISSDRSGAAVNSLFTTLTELRDALLADDDRGIFLAGGKLDADAERLTQARGMVGNRGARVDAVQSRLGETMLLDEGIRSGLRDLDFTEAATRLNLLNTQLQAGYQVSARTQQLSLLNFLR
jgi:flagellin-like hook-associated protein FlgL